MDFHLKSLDYYRIKICSISQEFQTFGRITGKGTFLILVVEWIQKDTSVFWRNWRRKIWHFPLSSSFLSSLSILSYPFSYPILWPPETLNSENLAKGNQGSSFLFIDDHTIGNKQLKDTCHQYIEANIRFGQNSKIIWNIKFAWLCINDHTCWISSCLRVLPSTVPMTATPLS